MKSQRLQPSDRLVFGEVCGTGSESNYLCICESPAARRPSSRWTSSRWGENPVSGWFWNSSRVRTSQFHGSRKPHFSFSAMTDPDETFVFFCHTFPVLVCVYVFSYAVIATALLARQYSLDCPKSVSNNKKMSVGHPTTPTPPHIKQDMKELH